MAKKAKTIDEAELIKRAHDNFDRAYEAFESSYDEMVDDLKFANGEQWPEAIKRQREADDRPCLRINKMPQFIDRVLGDMRQARPSIKYRPVDSNADPETAEVLTGLARNIEQQSDADVVYDSGGEAMVRCGYGAWRVVTEYESDKSFDQEIRLQRIKNQFAVLFDPTAKNWHREDGRFLFVYEDMPRSMFKKRFNGKEPTPFSGGGDDLSKWCTEETVRVAEYYEKDIEEKPLYLVEMADDKQRLAVTKLPEEPHEVLKTRKVKSEKITWYRIDGRTILEGPTPVVGRLFPVVPVYGKETTIEGKSHYSGVVRHAKDSQRLYNYYRSMDAETIALAPKAPWIMTKHMLGTYKRQWKDANKRNFAYLLYVPDPKAPGAKPERNIPALANQAIMQNVMIADQELHDTTGLQLASLGKKSNEQSGKAIEARAKEGDIGQYTYVDNLVRSIKHTAKIIVGMVPEIYDTPRLARILNEDDSVKNVKVNQPTKDDKGESKMFDLTTGKYDVVVSVGPSYQTQRQESLAAMLDFAKIMDPEQRAVVSDQIAKTSDWPGADKIAERLKRTIPPEVIGDDEEGQENQEPRQPTEQEIKAQAAQEALIEIEMETKEAELAKLKAEVQIARAEAAEAEAKAAIAEADARDRAAGITPEKKAA